MQSYMKDKPLVGFVVVGQHTICTILNYIIRLLVLSSHTLLCRAILTFLSKGLKTLLLYFYLNVNVLGVALLVVVPDVACLIVNLKLLGGLLCPISDAEALG